MTESHNPPLLSHLLDVIDKPGCPEDYRDTAVQERQNVCVPCPSVFKECVKDGQEGCNDTAV